MSTDKSFTKFMKEEAMKKTRARYPVVVLALFVMSVVTFSGIAQADTVPDGFIGVPWGASIEQIIKTMNERGYQQLTESPLVGGLPPGELVFRGAFAGTPCQLTFKLVANSFYSAEAMGCARSDHPVMPQDTYRQIVNELSEKFGPPQEHWSKNEINNGIEIPYEKTAWGLVDSKTSDKYSIEVDFTGTWFTDTEGVQYAIFIDYRADSLGKRLKMKEY